MLHHIVRSAESKVDCDSNSFPSFSSHVVVSNTRFMHLFQQPSCRPFKLSRSLRENWSLISSADCTASSKASFMLVRTGMPRQDHSITAIRQDTSRKVRHFKNPKSDFCWKKGNYKIQEIYSAECCYTTHSFVFQTWNLDFKQFLSFG